MAACFIVRVSRSISFFVAPEVRLHPGGGGRRPVAPLGQVLQTSDAMLRQEVQRFRRPLQVLDGCPMLVTGALLGFDIVLDVDEQAGLPVRCFGWREGLGLPAIRAVRASSA